MEQHGDRRSVLLVEDEVLVRLSVADELRLNGLTVIEAGNADEASTILESRAAWIGVVVTDIQMPGSMDGVGLVRLVRERYPEARVVVLSGASPKILQRVQADVVMAKPHDPARLIRQIRQLLPGDGTNGSRTSNAGNS